MSELQLRADQALLDRYDRHYDFDTWEVTTIVLDAIRAAIADDPQLLTELGCEQSDCPECQGVGYDIRLHYHGAEPRVPCWVCHGMGRVFRVLGVQAATPKAKP